MRAGTYLQADVLPVPPLAGVGVMSLGDEDESSSSSSDESTRPTSGWGGVTTSVPVVYACVTRRRVREHKLTQKVLQKAEELGNTTFKGPPSRENVVFAH